MLPSQKEKLAFSENIDSHISKDNPNGSSAPELTIRGSFSYLVFITSAVCVEYRFMKRHVEHHKRLRVVKGLTSSCMNQLWEVRRCIYVTVKAWARNANLLLHTEKPSWDYCFIYFTVAEVLFAYSPKVWWDHSPRLTYSICILRPKLPLRTISSPPSLVYALSSTCCCLVLGLFSVGWLFSFGASVVRMNLRKDKTSRLVASTKINSSISSVWDDRAL